MIGGWGSREDGPSLQRRSPSTCQQIMQLRTLTEGAVNAWISKVSTVISDAGLGKVVTRRRAIKEDVEL